MSLHSLRTWSGHSFPRVRQGSAAAPTASPRVQERVLEQLRDGQPPSRVEIETRMHDFETIVVSTFREVNDVGFVGDGVHLLDEGEVRKGGAAVDHLVEDATQGPDVGRSTHFDAVAAAGDRLGTHIVQRANLVDEGGQGFRVIE